MTFLYVNKYLSIYDYFKLKNPFSLHGLYTNNSAL